MGSRTWTDDQLIDAVQTSKTIADVLRKLDLKTRPGNYPTIRKHIARLRLDASHFTGKAHGSTIPRNKRTDIEVFVKDSDYSRCHLKQRIITKGLISYQCQICKRSSWNNKPLTLILDHINGVHNDHRLTNLRFLCPNCNSQEPTFCRGHKLVSQAEMVQAPE